MDGRLQGWVRVAAVAATLALAACAGHGARDFRGRWDPLDRWAEHTAALPLRPAHVFRATPLDGTLRNLLARWARDGGARLDYRHPDDFVLHRGVVDVGATTLEAAVARLAGVFADTGVEMRVEHGLIVVDGARPGSGEPAAAPADGQGGS